MRNLYFRSLRCVTTANTVALIKSSLSASTAGIMYCISQRMLKSIDANSGSEWESSPEPAKSTKHPRPKTLCEATLLLQNQQWLSELKAVKHRNDPSQVYPHAKYANKYYVSNINGYSQGEIGHKKNFQDGLKCPCTATNSSVISAASKHTEQ